MILERIKSLLIPKVSLEAKVSGVALFLAKTLDKFDGRIGVLESRQFERGWSNHSNIGMVPPG